MNAVVFFIIGIPLIEIYLMIKVGSFVGAFNTIFLIFFTAVSGLYFSKLAGLRTLKSGFKQIVKNEIPIYEIISGAAISFAALLLIFPGFLTDLIGFLLIVPFTRKIIIRLISAKFNIKKSHDDDKNNIIEGDFEETKKDDDS
tara:strand:- start:500 stop:928 length:429 start_codon:yes stop_codon:yes gene_type:complete